MIADRTRFAIGHAAEMVLIEVEYASSFTDTAPTAAYNMAIEILAALLDLDGEPAKAVLDRAITRLIEGNPDAYGLAPPTGLPVTFDQAEAAGVDGTLRSIA